jgi:DNA-binding NarL/FixJ family response regulator
MVYATDIRRSVISVAVIDSNVIAHAGVRPLVAKSGNRIRIAECYGSPAQFIAAPPEHRHAVDVVLFDLDVDRQGPDFESLAKLIAGGHRVVVYTELANDEVILTSLDLGAASYVIKSEVSQYLIEALNSAHQQIPYVAPRMGRALLNHKRLGRPGLSHREREVLVAWFRNGSIEGVAEALRIEPSTVRTHLQRVRAKYASVGRAAPTKAALIARALQDGLLRVGDL